MRVVLLARGLIGLWFGTRIFTLHEPLWGATFDVLALYLLVDGVLGILLALLSFREATVTAAQREWTLAVVFLVDGAGRTLAGTSVRVWPGLSGFPVTAVIAIGVMAACTAAVGFSELTLVAEEEVARHGHRHSRAQLSAGPTAAASVLAILFGVGAVVSIGDPDRARTLIAAFVVATGVVMLCMAWSARARQRARRRPSIGS
jgi:hypothetical protein